MKYKTIVSLLAILPFLSACQDHHFVPMEKADTIKLPTGQVAAPARSFAEGPTAQKQVMAEATAKRYPNPTNPETAIKEQAHAIVEGSLELGPDQKKRDFKGFTIYVIVRGQNLQGPPLAAARLDVTKFPIEFKIGMGDMMTDVPPVPKSKLMVEARLDRDGDPMTKEKGDVWGITLDPVSVGAKNVKIILSQDRK